MAALKVTSLHNAQNGNVFLTLTENGKSDKRSAHFKKVIKFEKKRYSVFFVSIAGNDR